MFKFLFGNMFPLTNITSPLDPPSFQEQVCPPLVTYFSNCAPLL